MIADSLPETAGTTIACSHSPSTAARERISSNLLYSSTSNTRFQIDLPRHILIVLSSPPLTNPPPADPGIGERE